METKNPAPLSDPSVFPDETVLREVLGANYPAFEALLDLFKRHEITHEWRYYNDGKSWLCKVEKKKKTIVWMSAREGYIKAAIYLPTRLAEEVYALPLADETRERFRSTPPVGKSMPCTFDVQTTEVIRDLETLLLFKIRAK